MSMYWIYDLPNWQLAVAIEVLFVGLSVAGLYVSRPLAKWLLNGSPVHNDIVSFVFSGIGVFYRLALGLIAVATWEDFTDVDGLVGKEAALLAGLFRDLDGYPQPFRGQVEAMLRDYTHAVIEKDWPAHQVGRRVDDGTLAIDRFENAIMAFEPTREREKIVHADVLRSLDLVVESRRLRLLSVTTGLPAALWSVVVIGALLTMALTYLFWVENRCAPRRAGRHTRHVPCPLDLPDRGDGQPVPRPVQRLARRLPDGPRRGHGALTPPPPS